LRVPGGAGSNTLVCCSVGKAANNKHVITYLPEESK